MNLTEKVAYLKGLMDGMEIDLETKEGKLFAAIADVLEDLALSVSDLDDEMTELSSAVDEIDEDLAEVEEIVFDDEDDDEYFEVECPVCGEEFYVDAETVMEGEAVCPECGTEIEVEVEGEVDDEDEDDEEFEDGGDCGCKNH